jgi:site-specific recombinase XerD
MAAHPAPFSPLRQRMLRDMMMRSLSPRTQHQYVRNVQRFAAFLDRPPDNATAEDLRNFQIHQHECGANAGTINSTVSALRFLYTVTLRRRDLARGLAAARRPHTVREVLSVEEVARLLEAAQAAEEVPDEPADVRPPYPCRGGRMIVIEVFARWRQPRAPAVHAAPARLFAP